jgi:hypothetical protein
MQVWAAGVTGIADERDHLSAEDLLALLGQDAVLRYVRVPGFHSVFVAYQHPILMTLVQVAVLFQLRVVQVCAEQVINRCLEKRPGEAREGFA